MKAEPEMIELGDPATCESSPMARAFQQGGTELGIRFVSPYALVVDDTTCWVAGWIPDFGCAMGTIICGRHCHEAALEIAEKLGHYTSGLSPDCYETFDRLRFIETLNDWGWFGDRESAPSWVVHRADVGA